MESSAPRLDLGSAETMPLVLPHRSSLRYGRIGLRALAGLVYASAFLEVLFSFTDVLHQDYDQATIPGFYGVGLAAAMYLIQRYALEPLANSTIHLYADHLVQESSGKSISLRFDEIVQVRFPAMSSLRTHFLIASKEHEPMIIGTDHLRTEAILEAIAAFNPALVPAEKLESYRRSALLQDQSSQRLHKKIAAAPSLILKFVGAPLMAAVAVTLSHKSDLVHNFLNALLSLSALHLVIGGLVYLASDLCLRALGSSPRLPVLEKRVEIVSASLHYAVLVALTLSFILAHS
jgi:hypothetical protein